jgi:toxin ParE1/3/4
VAREVVLRPSSLADLRDLYDYIERDSPVNAARYVDQIEAFCMKLSGFPERGMRRDDLMPGLRVLGFRRCVNVAFVIFSERVEIARILYGGRDLDHAFDENGDV